MSESYANGPADEGRYIDTLDPEDPEYVRQMRRPVEVKEDVRRMEERQRVKLVLHSKAFREELEELVVELQTGGSSSGVPLPTPMVFPPSNTVQQTQASSLIGRGMGTCIPIADVRDVDTSEYDKGERLFRCKLASLYRLVDLFGWSHGIDSYVTGRISQDFEHFLIAPYGMLHHEVTASSLIKVDMRGDILDSGASGAGLGVNKVGFSLHAAVYATRPDIKCIVHIRCASAIAVSALQCGLLPVCPEAMSVGDASYYDYIGAVMDTERRDKLRRALGPSNKILVLRNFGLIVGGETIEEAFWLARNVMTGVDFQLHSIAGGIENIQLPSEEEKRKVMESVRQAATSEDGKKWRLGEQDFETLMKHLDNVGYRTGYIYRESGPQQDDSKQANSEVVVPPTTSSYTYSFEDDTGKKASPGKGKIVGVQKKANKSDWLGTGKRGDELDETTTSVLSTSKAAGTWVPEDASTPIRPEGQVPVRKSAADIKPRKETFENTMEVEKTQIGAGGDHAPIAQPPTKPVHNGGDGPQTPSSPQKSVSSTEGALDDHEVSKDTTLERDSSKKKKKGLGFHIPSFGSKKKEK